VVVGAGPAGTAAAITAVGHGLRVVCVDKAGFPRDKTCGDGVTAHALRLLQLLYSLVMVSFPVEVWRQPRVPDSGAAYLDLVAEPLP